jgi:hypothetical protein
MLSAGLSSVTGRSAPNTESIGPRGSLLALPYSEWVPAAASQADPPASRALRPARTHSQRRGRSGFPTGRDALLTLVQVGVSVGVQMWPCGVECAGSPQRGQSRGSRPAATIIRVARSSERERAASGRARSGSGRGRPNGIVGLGVVGRRSGPSRAGPPPSITTRSRSPRPCASAMAPGPNALTRAARRGARRPSSRGSAGPGTPSTPRLGQGLQTSEGVERRGETATWVFSRTTLTTSPPFLA